MPDRTVKIKTLLSVVVCVSVGLVVWIFIQSRQPQSPPSTLSPEKTPQSVMALSRIHHTATKDGAVQWKLEAGSAELETDNGHMVLKNPLVDFYLKDGSLVNLKASTGILNTKSNDIEVHGNVVLFYDRYTLKTEALAYHHKNRQLQAMVPVQITGHLFNLKAATMIYDLDTNQTTFNGDVKGTIHEIPAS